MTFPQCNLSQLKTHFKILLQIHWLFFVPFFVTPHDLHNLYIIFLGFMRLGTKETNQLIQLFFFFSFPSARVGTEEGLAAVRLSERRLVLKSSDSF